MITGNFFTAFKWVYQRLQPMRKKQFWLLFAVMVVAAFFETLALGSIAFFASVITDPGNVKTSKYLAFIKIIIDADFLNSTDGLIIASGIAMCFLVALKNSLKTLSIYWAAKFSTAMEAYFGHMLLDGFLKMPYHWHLSKNSADLINAIQWRRYLGRDFFLPTLKLFNDLLMVFILLITLFVVQPVVSAIVTIALGSSAFLIFKIIRKKVDSTSTLSKNYEIALNKEVSMSIQGIKDVKISGTEKAFGLKYLENAVPLSKIFSRQRAYGDSPELILETFGFFMLFLSICIMLFKYDITKAYMVGTMSLLGVTAWKILPAISHILSGLSTLRFALPMMRSLASYIILIESEIDFSIEAKKESLTFNHVLEFKRVSFAYDQDGPTIIRDLNFSVKKGETVGIIGTSGAGKSTLVDLMIGLLQPVSGTIKIDGQALTPETIPLWLKITGFVSQSPFIYDGTIAGNIAFGKKTENMDRLLINDCCTMASMDDFVGSLPDGIDTFIGERGIKLSGGQRQRVAIARALYRRPGVLIFDEATSALDTKNEKSIQKTIYGFKGTQTLIIIAHRLSTVEDCDKVIWLEKGALKMVGIPEEILPLYEIYQNDPPPKKQ